ncbi:MAG: hypothetical protein ACFFG0_17605 [Candidatus Thorarchaeota archaeon]
MNSAFDAVAISGFIYLIIIVFLIISAILMLFLPFYVLRIRNEAITNNKNLSKIVRLLEKQVAQLNKMLPESDRESVAVSEDWICVCGTVNRNESVLCKSCGKTRDGKTPFHKPKSMMD